MIIVQVQNAVKEYNGVPLFSPVSFEINEKERIALIGPNGTGKSTIIKMITGELETDSGKVVIGKGFTIGYLSQSVISDLGNTLYEEASSVFADLEKMGKDLQAMCHRLETEYDNQELLETYSKLETKFSELGGYDYHYKIDMMLGKFGFDKKDFDRPISTFSGGERMKMAFAKILLMKPDLLLLDEPTNHLDIDTIEWLESYLKTYPGSVFFVSHDRYFINALANKIIELDQHKIETYIGDYEKYAVLKKERYEQQLKAYKHQQAEMKKLEWFITYYMPKPRFVSRAHDREKKLARLKQNAIEAPKETKNKISMNITGEIRKGKKLISIENMTVGYDEPLVSNINLLIEGGDKLAILGPNGSGKTTFIKTIKGELRPLSGECEFLTDLNIGYLRQDGINLRSPQTIFEYFRDMYPEMSNQEIYNHLGRFAFSYDEVNEKVIDNLSGGERMRVVIAEMVLRHYDVLILDEPTNHLDMMTKEELIEALNDYKGTLLVVSHDRYFVDKVTNKLIFFHNHKTLYYASGTYSEFKVDVLDPLVNKENEEISNQKALEEQLEREKYKARVKTEKKKINKPKPKLAKNKIEEKLARLERDLSVKHSYLDLPEYYQNSQKMNELSQEISSLEKEYESLIDELSLYDED